MILSLLKWTLLQTAMVIAVDGNYCFHPGQRLHTIVTMSKIDQEGVFSMNTIASYRCDRGYQLLNNESRHCMKDGTWSGSEPYCGINVATTGHVRGIFIDNEFKHNVESKNVLDEMYETCLPETTSKEAQVYIQLNKTYSIDLLKLAFKVPTFDEKVIPDVYYSSTHDIRTQERHELTVLQLRRHHSEVVKDETYAVFQYTNDRPSLSNNVSLRIAWPDGGFALCDISTYTSSVIPEDWCQIDKDKHKKYLLHDDKCYVAFQGGFYTRWEKAKESCETYSRKRLSLAKFNKDPTKTYVGDSLKNKSIDYWIINLNTVNDSPNCSSFNEFDTRVGDWHCDIQKGRICEFDIPKCGSPDQRNGTLMVHNEKTANYCCPKNFELSGDAERHCSNGQWSSEAPTCTREVYVCASKEMEIKNIIYTTVIVVALIIIVQWLMIGSTLIYLKYSRQK